MDGETTGAFWWHVDGYALRLDEVFAVLTLVCYECVCGGRTAAAYCEMDVS